MVPQTFTEKQTAEPQSWLTNLPTADLNFDVSDTQILQGGENVGLKKNKQMVNELWGPEPSVSVGLSCLFTQVLVEAVLLP